MGSFDGDFLTREDGETIAYLRRGGKQPGTLCSAGRTAPEFER